MVYDIMNDKQRKVYEEFFETDFSFEIPNLARFRVNAFNQNRGAGAVFRNIPVGDQVARGPERAEGLQGPVACCRAASCWSRARPAPASRRRSRRMVDYVNVNRAGPHHHDRGSDRVRARVQAQPDQPARSAPRHARVQRGAALGAARGSRRRPGRRDARPGDDPPRAHRGRDRPPSVRHPAHELGGEDHRPHRRRVPGSREGDGPLDAVRVAARGHFADAAEATRRRPHRGARDHDRDAGDPEPDPRGQDRADVLVDPDRPGTGHADARPVPHGNARPRGSSPRKRPAPRPPARTACNGALRRWRQEWIANSQSG